MNGLTSTNFESKFRHERFDRLFEPAEYTPPILCCWIRELVWKGWGWTNSATHIEYRLTLSWTWCHDDSAKWITGNVTLDRYRWPLPFLFIFPLAISVYNCSRECSISIRMTSCSLFPDDILVCVRVCSRRVEWRTHLNSFRRRLKMRFLLYATVVNIQYCFWDNTTPEETKKNMFVVGVFGWIRLEIQLWCGPMLITFEDNHYQHHIVKFYVLTCRGVRMYYHVGVRWWTLRSAGCVQLLCKWSCSSVPLSHFLKTRQIIQVTLLLLVSGAKWSGRSGSRQRRRGKRKTKSSYHRQESNRMHQNKACDKFVYLKVQTQHVRQYL